MATRRSRSANARHAERQHQHLQGKLLQLQSQRIAATNHFLAASERYASAAQCHQATVELTELLINRYPDCPGYISLLVDRLMQGDEQLQAALREELG